MNVEEILTNAQQSSDAVADLLIELSRQNKKIAEAVQKACDLYFADVRRREKEIRDKVSVLEKQKKELDTQICEMQATVVDAAGTGNADIFAQAQDKLATIEARKTAISTQISMLQVAHVRGSEELYQAVRDAETRLSGANSEYEHTLDKIHAVVKTQVKIWSDLEGKSESSTYYPNTGHMSYKVSWVRDVDKVRDHYNMKPKAPKLEEEPKRSVINMETARYRVDYPS